MKKKILLLILIFLISIGTGSSQEISSYDAQVEIRGMVLDEKITIFIKNNHPTSLKRITYPFSGKVTDLKTYDDMGGLESEVELRGGSNYVTTDLRISLDFEEEAKVLYEFTDPASITFFNNTYILSTSFPLLANVKSFSLRLKLPEGTGLTGSEVDIVPAPTEITSDGRSVILMWKEDDPSDFRIFVRYEPLPRPTQNLQSVAIQKAPIFQTETFLLGLTSLMLLFFLSLLILKLRPKEKIEEKIDILKEDEQLILRMVAEKEGIAQREIQRETDFSKTKVSKILAELEKRGVVRKQSIGKKNKIYLTEKLKE